MVRAFDPYASVAHQVIKVAAWFRTDQDAARGDVADIAANRRGAASHCRIILVSGQGFIQPGASIGVIGELVKNLIGYILPCFRIPEEGS